MENPIKYDLKKNYLRCRVDHPECCAEGGGLLVLPPHAHAGAAGANGPRVAVPDDEIGKIHFYTILEMLVKKRLEGVAK